MLLLLAIFTFNVRAQDLSNFKQNKSSVHGSFSTTGIAYNYSGLINPRKPPFTYILSGNINVNLKGLVFPFSFTFSDRNFDFRQPFNRFGLSPQYKWITLHLGYRNIHFDKYVMGGHTVLGAGVELNPGHFRFGFVYGRLRKKTNHAINVNNPLSDTLNDFTRKMMSLKIGVGSNRTFFDLIVLWAADDTTSIESTYRERGLFPASNLVTGLNSKIALSKTLHFEGEIAFSVYTLNQNSAIKYDVPQFLEKIIPVNMSTNGYMAARALLEYKNKKGLRFGLLYRRVDPDYASMGTYFINNDVENITLNTGFMAIKRKLRFNGSFGLERNNLNTRRNATTKKMIGSAMISYDPVKFFGMTINYSNYSVNQQPGRIQIADSIKLYQTNGSIMFMPHFQFINKDNKISHIISYAFTRMNLNDKNEFSTSNMDFVTLNHIFTYGITFIPARLSLTANFNYNQVLMEVSNSTNIGANLGVNKSLMKNKLAIGISSNFMKSKNDTQSVMVITPRFSTRVKLGKHHRFKLRFNIISTHNQTNDKTSLEEIGDLNYVFSF